MFYYSKSRFVEYDQALFETGDESTELFFVMSGMISIIISDGKGRQECLDILGKGSIIGFNSILTNEKWNYRAINMTTQSVKIISLNNAPLRKMAENHTELCEAIDEQVNYFLINGMPQIDYMVKFQKMNPTEIQDNIINFGKSQIWKEMRFDYLNRMLVIDKYDGFDSNCSGD